MPEKKWKVPGSFVRMRKLFGYSFWSNGLEVSNNIQSRAKNMGKIAQDLNLRLRILRFCTSL